MAGVDRRWKNYIANKKEIILRTEPTTKRAS